MSLSKDDVERIVGDFDKIASRTSKKSVTAGGRKILMVSIIVIIVIVAIVGYLYWRKKGSSPKGSKKSKSLNGEGESSDKPERKVEDKQSPPLLI
jgi:hypothetical protein